MELLIIQFSLATCHFIPLWSLNFPFSQTPSICVISLMWKNMKDQVSQPYKTAGKIIFYFLIFTFLDRRDSEHGGSKHSLNLHCIVEFSGISSLNVFDDGSVLLRSIFWTFSIVSMFLNHYIGIYCIAQLPVSSYALVQIHFSHLVNTRIFCRKHFRTWLTLLLIGSVCFIMSVKSYKILFFKILVLMHYWNWCSKR
jgi:hypothetical protein